MMDIPGGYAKFKNITMRTKMVGRLHLTFPRLEILNHTIQSIGNINGSRLFRSNLWLGPEKVTSGTVGGYNGETCKVLFDGDKYIWSVLMVIIEPRTWPRNSSTSWFQMFILYLVFQHGCLRGIKDLIIEQESVHSHHIWVNFVDLTIKIPSSYVGQLTFAPNQQALLFVRWSSIKCR